MKEAIVEINKTKRCSLRRYTKLTKLQPNSSRKKKREKIQISKIRTEKGEVATENAEIQRIMRLL